MGAGDSYSPSSCGASVMEGWVVDVLSRSDTRLLIKLSLAGMKGLGASCWEAEDASSVFRGGVGESPPPKGTTEGAAASRTGVSLALFFASGGPNSESESVQLRTEASFIWPLSSHSFLQINKIHDQSKN